MKARLKALAYACAFTALSGYFIYTGVYDLCNSLRIARDGVTTEGVVVTVERIQKYKSDDNFYLTVQFTDHNGKHQRFRNRRPYSFLFAPDAGDNVEVRYLRSDSGVVMLASLWESLLGPLFSLAFGLFFAWVSIQDYREVNKNIG